MSRTRGFSIVVWDTQWVDAVQIERDILPKVAEETRYLIGQIERCPETKKLHFQGYVYFSNARTASGVKKWLGGYCRKFHVEAAKGSADQNYAYCTKDASRVAGPFESGDRPEQGKRSDVEGLVQRLKSGASEREICEEFPGYVLRYGRGVDRLRAGLNGRRGWPMEVHVLYGPPGAGKSRRAWDDDPSAYAAIVAKDRIWFDGYSGENTIILDDYRGEAPIAWLLKFLDRYPMRVETKGGSLELTSHKIWITSNVSPSEWYPRALPQELEALQRRFSSCLRVGALDDCVSDTEVRMGNTRPSSQETGERKDNVAALDCLDELLSEIQVPR